MTIVTKVGVMSVAKVYAVIMGVSGLIFGLLFALLGGLVASIPGAGASGLGLGFIGIVVLPIMYAIFGFIAGAISAAIYNLVAGWVGGIELELRS